MRILGLWPIQTQNSKLSVQRNRNADVVVFGGTCSRH